MDQAFTVSADDQRSAIRFDTEMPVEFAGQLVQAQNISATGVYFETDIRHDVGTLVNFTLEYQLGGRLHRLECEGKVVRVDARGERVGIAARMVAPFFEEVEVIQAPVNAPSLR